jgi:myo-inositol catabolism protein IolH
VSVLLLANFKVAVETTLFARMSLEEALAASAKCGFTKVEMGLTHFDTCGASKDDRTRLEDLLSKHGLGIAGLFALAGWNPSDWTKSSPGISSPNEAERKKSVKQMRQGIENASALGCKLIMTELDGDMDEKDASLRSFKKSIEELLPDLASNDVTFCFEPHPGDFIEDSFEAIELLKSFHAKQIRYNYCVAHSFCLRHTPKEIIANAGKMIAYVHYSDTLNPQRIFFCPTYKPKIIPHLHLVAGEGDIDFDEVLGGLNAVNYSGYLTVHPFSRFDDPLPAARKTKSKLEKMLAAMP